MQHGRLCGYRTVDIERTERRPSPRQCPLDRRQVPPDEVDDIDAQDLADIREDRGGFADRGRFGDGGDRVAHAVLWRLPFLADRSPAPSRRVMAAPTTPSNSARSGRTRARTRTPIKTPSRCLARSFAATERVITPPAWPALTQPQ